VLSPPPPWQRAVNLRRRGRTTLLNRVDASQETASEETRTEETESRETASNTAPDTAPRQTAPQGGVAVQPSGVFTMILLRSLEERLTVDQIEELLRKAGETRGLAAFKETAASTSIEQFSRLRHEADLVLGLGSGRRR
jgi:hypothetical protein